MAQTLKFGNGTWATKKGSTLAFNDEDGNYKPLPFTTTRTTSATRVNKEGLIETVGSGEPRIDFLGNTKGALKLEPQRTNLITQSNDFDTQSKQNVTVTSDAIISPDGSLNADKLVENSANSSHYLRINTSSSSASVISVFAKKGEETKIFIGNANFSQGVLFDLDLGIIESGSDGTIENYGNGWYKCSFYRTDLSAWQYISLRGNFTTYQGNGVNGVYLYGAQLEEGSYATSYIPTSGSAVTRVADVCSQTPPSGIIGQTEGVIFMDWIMNHQSNSTSEDVFTLTLSDGTTNNLFVINNYNNNLTVYLKAATNQFYNTSFSGSDGLRIKLAFAYKVNDFSLVINGNTIATDSSGTVPLLNKININAYETALPNDSILVNDLKLYNTRLTDSELAILTTI